MLSPDMILEDVLYGEELEAKKEYYKAYWVYMYAESAFEREDEAMCLIGTRAEFADAEIQASIHRSRVWKHLTEEEKTKVKQGVNPFATIPEQTESPSVSSPYDIGTHYYGFARQDEEDETRVVDKREERKDSFCTALFLIVIFIFHPSVFLKLRKK